MWHCLLWCASYFLGQYIEMTLNCQVLWELCYWTVAHILPLGIEWKKPQTDGVNLHMNKILRNNWAWSNHCACIAFYSFLPFFPLLSVPCAVKFTWSYLGLGLYYPLLCPICQRCWLLSHCRQSYLYRPCHLPLQMGRWDVLESPCKSCGK